MKSLDVEFFYHQLSRKHAVAPAASSGENRGDVNHRFGNKEAQQQSIRASAPVFSPLTTYALPQNAKNQRKKGNIQ